MKTKTYKIKNKVYNTSGRLSILSSSALSIVGSIVLLGSPCLGYAAPPDVGASLLLSADIESKYALLERTITAPAMLDGEFLGWLKSHPSTYRACLTISRSPEVVIGRLLDIKNAVGLNVADKYSELLLAAAVHSVVSERREVSKDYRVPLVVEYLLSNGIGFEDYIQKGAAPILKSLLLPPVAYGGNQKFNDGVAVEMGVFPALVKQSTVEQILNIIDFYEKKANKKFLKESLFPLESSPWYLLVSLFISMAKSEQEYVWTRYESGQELLSWGKGKYNMSYDSMAVRYRSSKYNPDSIMRIYEDGGVCGRLGQLTVVARNSVGLPTQAVYQPGHCANLEYRFDEELNQFTGFLANANMGMYNSYRPKAAAINSTSVWLLPVDGVLPEKSPLSYMPLVRQFREPERFGSKPWAGIEYHYSLIMAANLGPAAYADGNLYFNEAMQKMGQDKQELLANAIKCNPFNIDAWIALSKFLDLDNDSVFEFLKQMDVAIISAVPALSGDSKSLADVGNCYADIIAAAITDRVTIDVISTRLDAIRSTRNKLSSEQRIEGSAQLLQLYKDMQAYGDKIGRKFSGLRYWYDVIGAKAIDNASR